MSLIYNIKGTLFSDYCLCFANYSYRIFEIVEFQPSILPYSFGIGFRGRCIQGVTSLKGVHRLTRVTGSNSVYQCMEIIPFPVSTNAALF